MKNGNEQVGENENSECSKKKEQLCGKSTKQERAWNILETEVKKK